MYFEFSNSYFSFYLLIYNCVVDEMDQADKELKETIRKIWPLQAKKAIDKLLPPEEGILIFFSTNFCDCYNVLYY